MSHTLAIHWNQTSIDLAVVRHSVGRSKLESTHTQALDENSTPAEIGKHLKHLLSTHLSGRTKIVVAPGCDFFQWQNLSLPPCPLEDLPDLVHLQLMQEGASNGNQSDFLPLTGDENTPNRVWSISARPSAMAELEKICSLADVKPDRIVPLCLGYPALERSRESSSSNSSTISIAVHPYESTLWAEAEDKVVLFRQLNLPENSDIESLASALAGELRRSMLALGQELPTAESPTLQLIHSQLEKAQELQRVLSSQLETKVTLFEQPSSIEQVSLQKASHLPLAGLALQESHGEAALVDLLNPRQRPAPPSRTRTYVLAAVAAACLLAFAGMAGYNSLQNPLQAAETARSKAAELEPKVTYYEKAELLAAEIETWQQNSVNLLTTLDKLSTMLRPEKLDAEDFALEDDTVLERFDLSGKQLVIQGVVREAARVLPIENALRKRVVRVQREQSEPDTDIPNYPWGYKFVVDLTDLKPIEEASAE